MLVFNKEVYKVLTHPFLWSECYVFPAKNIKNLLPSVYLFYSYLVRRKVKLYHN